MLRRVARAAILALLLAQPAAAWTQVPSATGLVNIVQPTTLRTQAGTELVAFTDTKSNLFLVRNGTAKTLLSGLAFVGKPALVQQPSGAIQLYVSGSGGGLDGVGRLTSTDDGASWTGPIQTKSKNLADVGSATVAPDGTPYFTQSGTGFVNVWSGLNGESVTNVFTPCCGYAESVAVNSAGFALVAFWSNATAYPDRYVVTDGKILVPVADTQTASRDDRVPLLTVAQSMWLAWADGYPTATKLTIQDIAGVTDSVVVDRGKFQGGDPHMALAAEPDGKLWALWTRDGAVRAARSRTNAMPRTTFGATVTTAFPTGVTGYQLEALARPGSVTAYLNTGSTLVETRILPGLTVKATRKLATVTDDHFPVKGATLKGGGVTVKTDAKGRAAIAKIKAHTFVRVTAAGYTATGFRVP
jgi:hypothetical protein